MHTITPSPLIFIRPRCRNTLLYGPWQARLAASGGGEQSVFCWLPLIASEALFFVFFDFAAPAAWNAVLAIAVSFIWAFIPLQFALVLLPAVAEMKAAVVIAKQELLHDLQQAEAKPVSAESSLRRALPHVAAAATTAGRCSEVFGIVVLVRI